MKTVNYTQEGNSIQSALDGVIVRKHFSGLAGGRALDMTSYTAKVVPCGLPIITDGSGNYKPLPPTDTTVSSTTTYGFVLPDNWSYAGLCGATIRAGEPCSVLVAGVVNEPAMLAFVSSIFPSEMSEPNPISLSAIKSALPHIIWEKDEVGDAIV